MIRNDATAAQIRAAQPDASTWLAANAGSGKTRVLTDRVARLLLAGTPPERILCLTYTKAAATEMQNRLFGRLGGWSMLDDASLATALADLGVPAPGSSDGLQEARTLFARAIETPGGLRIQTIHAFCAAILRRFPLEAGVSPQFTEAEERATQLLRAEVLEDMATGADAPLIEAIAPFVEADPDPLLAEIAGARDAFTTAAADPAPDPAQAYGLPPGLDERALLAGVFHGDTLVFLHELVPALLAGSKTDARAGAALQGITAPDMAALTVLEGLFVFKSGQRAGAAKIGDFPTKATRTGALAPAMPQLEALMEAVAETQPHRLALAAARRDAALHAFAQRFLARFAEAKMRRGWLDFDDLILRTRDLLRAPGLAEWVLYRLDGGIDHILVDEAQDTSPAQWQVIERLAQEMTAGQGARADTPRTLFVVGDKKQSIYSFQGADPDGFDRMRDDFAARLAQTTAPLRNAALEHSFRSAAPILSLVDATFAGRPGAGFADGIRHRAFKTALPGRVELWPAVEKTDAPEDGPWYDPVDRTSPRHHTVRLAERIADFVRHHIDAGTPIPEERDGVVTTRPVQAGDVLILVRRRGPLFAEIIRAAKQARLPIAGADVLKVMAELAVRDVIALLRFLATPEDDLSLATALRSPLLGLSEADLYALAQPRGPQYLWQAMRGQAEAYPEATAILRDLRNEADFLRPYDLINRILTRHRGRQRLIGRLGPEAEDGLDALLAQALAFEATEVPSLTGFLAWAEADTLKIKRRPDASGTQLRVMTVHGAKGLEAPLVILPDCADFSPPRRGALLRDDAGPMWALPAPERPARQAEAAERRRTAEAQERDRLLYVAMTRAETWLVVAAAGDLGSTGESWHDRIAAGMAAAGAAPARLHAEDATDGLLLQSPGWGTLPAPQRDRAPETPEQSPPDWLDAPAPAAQPAPRPRAPSDLGGAHALPGEGDDPETAKARGTALHVLLDALAPLEAPTRHATATRLLARLPVPDPAPVIDEALTVLATPALAPLFAPDSLAEVPFAADLPGVGPVSGTIDRLIVGPDTVLAVDFKSNRVVPGNARDTPEAILRQMGAYRAALAALYPGRRVDVALVWTATATRMDLPHDLVDAALARAAPP